MAGVTLSGISAVLNLMYAPGVSEQFRRDAVLPNLVPVVYEANGACYWKAKIAARSSAGPRAQGADASDGDYTTDVRVPANLAWAHYEAFAKIDGTAQRIAAANPGYQASGSELDEEIRDAGDELTVEISEDSYAGSVAASPVEIEGLARAVDATGTYANIAQGTYADWASGEASIAEEDLSVAQIRTNLFRPVKDATGRNPSVVLCSGDIMDQIKSLADESRQNTSVIVNTPTLGLVDIARLGFDAVLIDSIPFVEDRHATSGTMYAGDLSQLQYVQVPPTWTSMDPGQLRDMMAAITGKNVPLSEIEAQLKAINSGPRRLMAQVNALAKTGDSTKIQLVIDLQLRLRKRNSWAKLALT